jgi:GNAT superfamily N-acetyltransferase
MSETSLLFTTLSPSDAAAIANVTRLLNDTSSAWLTPADVAFLAANSFGVLASIHDQIVGCAFYRTFDDTDVLLMLAVEPAWQRRRIGRNILRHLIGVSRVTLARQMVTLVPETLLPMHRLLKSVGFRCNRIFKSPGAPDRYQFRLPMKNVWLRLRDGYAALAVPIP